VATTLGFVLFFAGAGIIRMARATVLIVGSLYLFEKAGQEASTALQRQEADSEVG
jgi:hypothetical protein